MSDWHDDENHDVRIAFGELSMRDRLAEALLDESGLRPTNNALDVLLTVARELDRTDQGWAERNTIGSPGLVSYALDAESALRVLRKNR